MPSYRNGS